MRLFVSSNRRSDVVAGPEKPFGLLVISSAFLTRKKTRLKEGIIEHSQHIPLASLDLLFSFLS